MRKGRRQTTGLFYSERCVGRDGPLNTEYHDQSVNPSSSSVARRWPRRVAVAARRIAGRDGGRDVLSTFRMYDVESIAPFLVLSIAACISLAILPTRNPTPGHLRPPRLATNLVAWAIVLVAALRPLGYMTRFSEDFAPRRRDLGAGDAGAAGHARSSCRASRALLECRATARRIVGCRRPAWSCRRLSTHVELGISVAVF
jgi:hypothetical protein